MSFFFCVDRRDGKAIINSHTQNGSTNQGSNPDHDVRPNNFGIFVIWARSYETLFYKFYSCCNIFYYFFHKNYYSFILPIFLPTFFIILFISFFFHLIILYLCMGIFLLRIKSEKYSFIFLVHFDFILVCFLACKKKEDDFEHFIC